MSKTQKNNDDGGGFGGGFGGGNAGGKSSSAKKFSADQRNKDKTKKNNLEDLKPLWANKESMTPLMIRTVKAKEIKLKFEQQQLLQTITGRINVFDSELKVLRHEKSRISVIMKNADLRHVTIFEEFLLLRDFEKTENILEQKQIERKEGHIDLQRQLKVIHRAIDSKRKDIDHLDIKQKQLVETYNQATRDETKFADYLLKVFRKRIKRKKKTESDEEDEGTW